MLKTMAAVLHEMQREAQLDVRKLLSMEKRSQSQPALLSDLTCSQAFALSSLLLLPPWQKAEILISLENVLMQS